MGSKLCVSADSIDSEATPFIDRKTISKSILKKSESSNTYYKNTGESDTEKLIADSALLNAPCDHDREANQTRPNRQSPLLARKVLQPLLRKKFAIKQKSESSIETKHTSKLAKLFFDEASSAGKFFKRNLYFKIHKIHNSYFFRH